MIEFRKAESYVSGAGSVYDINKRHAATHEAFFPSLYPISISIYDYFHLREFLVGVAASPPPLSFLRPCQDDPTWPVL